MNHHNHSGPPYEADDSETTRLDRSLALASPIRTGPARVAIVTGANSGRKYPLADVTVVGRGSSATIQIDDPSVSRQHARIRRLETGEFEIEDLNSANGTMVNGEVIRKRRLTFGDKIQLGQQVILLFTQQDSLEEQLLRRQKMEAIGRLGAGIAHDFNNLLSAVQSNVQFLGDLPAETPLGDGEILDCLNDMRTAVRRAKELTERLVDFARGGIEKHEAVDLSVLCEEVLLLFRRTFSKSIRVESDIEPALSLRGNRTRLHQLLVNLCVNAQDAMPRGGTLSVRMMAVPGSQLQDTPVRWDGACAVILVQDTGVGMDEEVMQRIFEPFFTTKPTGTGTGLGLATVSEIVRWHGGYVDVKSTLGEGSTFRVILPLFESDQETTLTTPALKTVGVEPAIRPLTILLVEDEEIVARSAIRLLRQFGHSVVYARDGAEGIEKYRGNSEQKPDLVILDLDMPVLDGESCFRELIRMDPSVKAVFVSGHWDDARGRQLMSEGALDFLRKPYDIKLLRDALVKAAAARAA